MKQYPIRLGSSLLLCSMLGLYQPAYAEESSKPVTEAMSEAQASGEDETDSFKLEYALNKGDTHIAEVDMENPFMILVDILKASIAQANKTPGKAVDTEVMLPYPEDMAESVEDDLPNLNLQTQVGADKKGATQFSIAAFESDIENEEEDLEGQLSWLGLTGHITYTGDLEAPTGSMKMPGLSIDMGEEGSIKLDALSLSGSLDQYFEPLTLDFKLPQFKFISEETNILIDSLTGIFNMEEKVEGLKLGDIAFNLKEVKFDVEGEKFALKGLSLDSNGAMQSETLVKYGTQLNIAAIDLPTEAQDELGGLNALKMQLNLEFNNLDSASIADVQKTVRQLQAQGMKQEMLGFALMSKLMEIGPTLVKQSPEIAIKTLGLETNQGNVFGHFNLSIDGSKPFPFNQPDQMLQAVLGDTKIQISKSLLKKVITEQVRSEMPPEAATQEGAPKPEDMADMQIQAFVQQKFLVDSGDTYTLEANMKAGKLMLNGQEMPLPF